MSKTDKAEIIRDLFAAYLADDRAAIEAAFADDFSFTSPLDDAIGKAAYFARCWRSSDWIAAHDIEHIAVHGDVAFATYRCTTTGGKSFRNTEVFTFAGMSIRAIAVYFGATYQDGVFQKQAS